MIPTAISTDFDFGFVVQYVQFVVYCLDSLRIHTLPALVAAVGVVDIVYKLLQSEASQWVETMTSYLGRM